MNFLGGVWLDGSIQSNIIPKSSEKLLVLDLLWKIIDNGNTCFNKIRFYIPINFFLKIPSQLIRVQKSDEFNSFPLLEQRFHDDEMYDLNNVERAYNRINNKTPPRGYGRCLVSHGKYSEGCSHRCKRPVEMKALRSIALDAVSILAGALSQVSK